MIASPGDVQPERNMVRDVIQEWNNVNGSTRKVYLHAVGWETHSAPDFSGHPQEIINSQVLADSDLLVAIFWTRIGTKTPKAASGTVEEILEHVKAGKPAMLYFSSAPVRPDSVDSEQYAKLLEFKELCKSKGLFETFESLYEFRQKFANQLGMHLNRHPYFAKDALPEVPEISFKSKGPTIPDLSNEAKTLLVEASKDREGSIMRMAFIGGYNILTNNQQFVEPGNPRSRAAWDGAIEELLSQDLLEHVGSKREMFRVSAKGYKIADLLA
jgi:hypothetical protein